MRSFGDSIRSKNVFRMTERVSMCLIFDQRSARHQDESHPPLGGVSLKHQYEGTSVNRSQSPAALIIHAIGSVTNGYHSRTQITEEHGPVKPTRPKGDLIINCRHRFDNQCKHTPTTEVICLRLTKL